MWGYISLVAEGRGGGFSSLKMVDEAVDGSGRAGAEAPEPPSRGPEAELVVWGGACVVVVALGVRRVV